MLETLKIGSLGESVKLLQNALNGHGYKIFVDGDFGALTEAAVENFQEANGLQADGVVGPKTWNVLSAIPVKKPSSAKGTAPWYEEKFSKLTYDVGYEAKIKAAADRVERSLKRYKLAAASLGLIPWYFIAGVHNMEASGNFQGVLHNGQKIIGTGKKTTIVPIGRGPFETWEQSAVDVLRWKGLDKVTDWSLGNLLKIAERYNGAGYLTGAGRAENSPYLWAMSNINDGRGKYESDGKYNAAMDANGQVGFATLLKELEKRGLVSFA